MEKHKLPSLKDLSKKIGVHVMTLYAWRAGSRKPSEAAVQKLRDALDAPAWGAQEYMSQEFVAFNTTAYDAASGLYCTIHMNKRDMPSFMASMSVMAKIADLLEAVIAKRLHGSIRTVVRVGALYGDPENIVTADVLYLRANGTYTDYMSTFTVKTANIGGLLRHVYKIDNTELGNLRETLAGVVTDASIDRVVKSMFKFVKNNEKKQK